MKAFGLRSHQSPLVDHQHSNKRILNKQFNRRQQTLNIWKYLESSKCFLWVSNRPLAVGTALGSEAPPALGELKSKKLIRSLLEA